MTAPKPTIDPSMLWSHPIAFWDVVGVRLMIVGAGLGFLALLFSFVSSFVLWRVAGAAQAELAGKTGALSKDVTTAQFISVLRQAHLFVEDRTGSVLPLGTFTSGIRIAGIDQEFVGTLVSHLVTNPGFDPAQERRSGNGGAGMSSGGEAARDVDILIGPKPPKIATKQ